MTLPFSIILICAAVVLLVAFLLSSYVKAGPQKALIISGLSKEPRILIGKGGFRIPLLERVDELSLAQITIDINTKEPVPTADFIEVNIDAVAIIQVSKDQIQTAAKNYIGKDPTAIGNSVTQTLSGCLREAIGTVEFKELNLNRDAFSKTVTKNATSDIQSLGLEILSCNIERVSDRNGLIESLGADNTWKIKKDAAITKAHSERDIRETEAAAEQYARDREIASQETIAERENQLTIKRAELKKEADRHQADADAAYQIQAANQQKFINESQVEADIAKQKKQQQLTEEQIKVRANELQANVNKVADAERYKTEIDAAAALEKQRLEAEAKLVIQQKEAEAKRVQAEAQRYADEQHAAAIKAVAAAEAEKIRLTGEAEAAAIQAAGEAEAKALEKKADAFSKFNQAAVLDMVVKVLPQMAENVAKPISAIDSVKIYGGDSNGISQVAGNVPTVIAQTLETLESVGVPVKGILDAKTKDAMTDRHITASADLTTATTVAPASSKKKPLNS